ncbi:hypothetical protein [Arthrobacter rhombi]|uniref:hypothetical protein n=1 Tax=Arthrobacter rhombi TaxID=71253 RepID=UPI003FD0C934
MSEKEPQRNVGEMFAKSAAPKKDGNAPPRVTTHLPKKPAAAAPRAVAPEPTVAHTPSEVVLDVPTTANTSVSLPPAVFNEVRSRSVEERISNTELLVRAFADVPLKSLQAKLSSTGPTKSGGMPMPTTRRRRYGGGSTQMQLRLTPEQLAWLDEMKTTAGAPNRSVLVATVYALYLKLDIPGL